MTQTVDNHRLWTSETVREILGGVPASTWKKMVANGRVPAPIGRRIGKSHRWRAAEVIAWIDAGLPGRAAWEEIKTAAGIPGNRKQGRTR